MMIGTVFFPPRSRPQVVVDYQDFRLGIGHGRVSYPERERPLQRDRNSALPGRTGKQVVTIGDPGVANDLQTRLNLLGTSSEVARTIPLLRALAFVGNRRSRMRAKRSIS